MSDLNELLERVKAATGPDRQLDYALFCHFAPRDVASAWHPHEGHQYTASIDAAVALCERLLPGWKASHGEFSWSFGFQDERVWTCKLRYYRTKAHAPTLPLAILAGLLQALISQEQK